MIDRLSEALGERYDIREQLGEGGMATVFLARDLKHQRQVALKVMKPELTAVVGAERFLTEIETTANLTHPHILPLHDSGQVDGLLYYVMPYVEGESLREKLDRERQLPVDEAVRIAVDLCEALDYAHRHGVIHRDIKPGNILMHEGRPLIADFGIALAVGAAGGPRLTETGLSVGTPYYMSPEQATGDQTVGPGTDIYALGCVLYEMLVGEPPYTGATAQAVLGKIIQGGPVSATVQRSSIPPNVDAAIRKSLEKLPADRFTSAGGLGKALQDPAFRHGVGAAAAVADGGVWRSRALALGGLAAILALGLAAALFWPDPPTPVERWQVTFPDDQAHVDLISASFALMPDRSGLVYVGPAESGVQLWLKPRGLDRASPLAGTEGGRSPSPSPDGSWIAFVRGPQLLKIPSVGGATITLSDSLPTNSVDAGAWLEDGSIVYANRRWELVRVPAEGGASEVIWTPPENHFAYGPARIPGAPGLVFSLCGGGCGPDDLHEIRSLNLETGAAEVVAPGGVLARWAPTGDLVFVRTDGSMFAVPFDARRLQPTGTPVPVLEGVKVDGAIMPDFDLGSDGTLLVLTGGALSLDAEFVWVTRDGAISAVDPGWTFDPGAANRGWSLSPDDSRLALRAQSEAGLDIWVKELPDGPLSRLTFDPAEERMPRWTPDGEYVTFLSGRGGDLDVWRKRADGVGEAEPVYDHDRFLAQGFWSPDGEYLLLRTGGTAGVEGGRDILILRPDRDSAAVPLLTGEYDEWAPIISEDGRWLAHQSTETGRDEVFVRPFPNVTDGKWQISSGGGLMPLWSHAGDELFYVNADRELVAARVETEPRFRVVSRQVLFSLPDEVLTSTITGMYDITTDDQRFLMARLAGADDAPTRMILTRNWTREMRQRMGR